MGCLRWQRNISFRGQRSTAVLWLILLISAAADLVENDLSFGEKEHTSMWNRDTQSLAAEMALTTAQCLQSEARNTLKTMESTTVSTQGEKSTDGAGYDVESAVKTFNTDHRYFPSTDPNGISLGDQEACVGCCSIPVGEQDSCQTSQFKTATQEGCLKVQRPSGQYCLSCVNNCVCKCIADFFAKIDGPQNVIVTLEQVCPVSNMVLGDISHTGACPNVGHNGFAEIPGSSSAPSSSEDPASSSAPSPNPIISVSSSPSSSQPGPTKIQVHHEPVFISHGWRLGRWPCPCPWEAHLVCGMNGVTYPNECVARCYGVAVFKPGWCQEKGFPYSECLQSDKYGTYDSENIPSRLSKGDYAAPFGGPCVHPVYCKELCPRMIGYCQEMCSSIETVPDRELTDSPTSDFLPPSKENLPWDSTWKITAEEIVHQYKHPLPGVVEPVPGLVKHHLRRENTRSWRGSRSSRPTAGGHHKRETSPIMQVFRQKKTRNALLRFCNRELCLEHIQFLLAVNSYETLDDAVLANEAWNLYNIFCRHDGLLPLNLTQSTQEKIQHNISEHGRLRHLFEDAKQEVLSVVADRILPEYLKSEEYFTSVQPLPTNPPHKSNNKHTFVPSIR